MSSIYRTQVIYRDSERGRVLWATTADETLAIVECIETGRLPIVDIRPYGPLYGPSFDDADCEVRETQVWGNVPTRAWDVMLGPNDRYTVTEVPSLEREDGDLHCSCADWQQYSNCRHVRVAAGQRAMGITSRIVTDPGPTGYPHDYGQYCKCAECAPEPTCGLCGRAQDDSPAGFADADWNGETGNHETCEERFDRKNFSESRGSA